MKNKKRNYSQLQLLIWHLKFTTNTLHNGSAYLPQHQCINFFLWSCMNCTEAISCNVCNGKCSLYDKWHGTHSTMRCLTTSCSHEVLVNQQFFLYYCHLSTLVLKSITVGLTSGITKDLILSPSRPPSIPKWPVGHGTELRPTCGRRLILHKGITVFFLNTSEWKLQLNK